MSSEEGACTLTPYAYVESLIAIPWRGHIQVPFSRTTSGSVPSPKAAYASWSTW
ncbi:hypothetical protein ABZ615_36825 [Streptomyces sp. NPDC007325]|uniref:hypothetical protein n=1 Tax=Streptomyces sp. NPDC007325 TaxID=3154588 RepID=UPI0033C9B95E